MGSGGARRRPRLLSFASGFRRVALDTSACIYFLAGVEPWNSFVRNLVLRADGTRSTIELPGIVRAELLVRPMRTRDARELRRVLDFTDRRDGVQAMPVSDDVLSTAAQVRASTNLKMMDSLIIASAAVHGCEAIVGNDERFHTINDIQAVPAFAAGRVSLALPQYVHLNDYV